VAAWALLPLAVPLLLACMDIAGSRLAPVNHHAIMEIRHNLASSFGEHEGQHGMYKCCYCGKL
jgi:aspartate carbamoyltransferase regulatory subunit